MAGWIKMPLGTEVGLGPGDIVLDGDPSIRPEVSWSLTSLFSTNMAISETNPPRKRGEALPHCLAYVLSSNGWMDQDATWYGSRLDSGHIVLNRDPALPKRGTATAPNFGQCLLSQNGWMDQDETW